MWRVKNGIIIILVLVFVMSKPMLCIGQMNTNILMTQKEEGEEDEEKQSGILSVQSPSYILMEASTGKVILEKNAGEKRSPASITKIMTLLLIFDALHAKQITLQDEVTTSAYAKSMGGSQVFLEEGEVQTVDTLIKCIAVASGNDASVAMAEYIAGSEDAFVDKMNRKAEELGLKHTHFVDCCGLTNSDEHYTSAEDVAIMSRALIVAYPEIFDYTGIWMEDIIHTTNKGSKPFRLSSTNKLLKQYPWTTGLKTGSTKKAGYCLSATAKKDEISLIAVVMAAPDYKIRFSDAKALLDYGYQNCKLYTDKRQDSLGKISVRNGVNEEVEISCKDDFCYLDTDGLQGELQKELRIESDIEAPLTVGDKVGEVVYTLGGREVGRMDIVALEDVKKAGFVDCFRKIFSELLL